MARCERLGENVGEVLRQIVSGRFIGLVPSLESATGCERELLISQLAKDTLLFLFSRRHAVVLTVVRTDRFSKIRALNRFCREAVRVSSPICGTAVHAAMHGNKHGLIRLLAEPGELNLRTHFEKQICEEQSAEKNRSRSIRCTNSALIPLINFAALSKRPDPTTELHVADPRSLREALLGKMFGNLQRDRASRGSTQQSVRGFSSSLVELAEHKLASAICCSGPPVTLFFKREDDKC